MGEGGIGYGFMAVLDLIAFAVSLAPLILVFSIRKLREQAWTWAAASLITGLLVVLLAVQVRLVSGSAVNGDRLLFAAAALSLAAARPLFTKSHHPRNWLYGLAPLALVLLLSVNRRAYCERSEQLFQAVTNKDPVVAGRLLAAGADPDCFEVGHCAIDVAIQGKDWANVTLLVENGVTDREYYPGNQGPPTTRTAELERCYHSELASRMRSNTDVP